MSRIEPYGRVYYEAVTGGGYSGIARFTDDPDVFIPLFYKVINVYTADQIRKLVEETRKDFPLDPYTLSQDLRDTILDTLLAQLGEKNGDHS